MAAIMIEAISPSPHLRLATTRQIQKTRFMKKTVSPTPRKRRGFTLIELMVVLVIIGVLAALIVPNVLDRADDARGTAARTDVNNIVQALKLYRLDNQRYPTSEQGLEALVRKPGATPIPGNWRPYLEKLPNDPWGRPYQYLNPGVKGEIDVMSLGADGKAGGEGNDADIGSWQ
jgi:general secretion pathway protein G